ncbi:family 1 glycosylhydrolase [bacterium]|nr:family 1 glycosylhydrolase [bacterium]
MRIFRTVALKLLGCILASFFLAKAKGLASEYPYNDSRWVFDKLPKADFSRDRSKIIAQFPKGFEFGLATAPAHVEDSLEDSWLEFAKRGGVKAFNSVKDPTRRLDFFTNPEVEILLAKESGAKVFRLGVDWGRLVPNLPGSLDCGTTCSGAIQNYKALSQYKRIISLIKKHDMKVMLTLFHHSLPMWSIKEWHSASSTEKFGWKDKNMPAYFKAFTRSVVKEFGSSVDSFITFNEPSIFSLLNHVAGIWPPAKGKDAKAIINTFFYKGSFHKALDNMIEAHRLAYDEIKAVYPKTKVGIAHHVSYAVAKKGVLASIALHINETAVNYKFPDKIIDKLDFLGVNYYGQENVSATDYSLDPKFAYSESGRMINPNGLLIVLRALHDRYKKKNPGLRYYITENGVADDTDLIRQPYIIEHLLALKAAMDQGIPVDGYIFWTISDNWEWADGYCPKFGLVLVDRKNNLKRYKRPSFYLFQHIAKTGSITKNMRASAQNLVWAAQNLRLNSKELQSKWDGKRPFCRNTDGLTSHDKPNRVPMIMKEKWWFKN